MGIVTLARWDTAMVVREDESLQVLHDMDLQVHGGGRPVTIVPCGRQVHSGVE